jgi:hypothetical protein
MLRKQDNGKRTISSEKLVAHVVKVVGDEGLGQNVGQLGLGRDKLDNSMTSIKDIEDVTNGDSNMTATARYNTTAQRFFIHSAT